MPSEFVNVPAGTSQDQTFRIAANGKPTSCARLCHKTVAIITTAWRYPHIDVLNLVVEADPALLEQLADQFEQVSQDLSRLAKQVVTDTPVLPGMGRDHPWMQRDSEKLERAAMNRAAADMCVALGLDTRCPCEAHGAEVCVECGMPHVAEGVA